MFGKKWEMSRGRVWKGLATTLVAVLIITPILGMASCGPAAPEVIKLKFSCPYLEVEPPCVYGLRVCDLVEQKTNGKVKIERFTGGTMGNVLEHLGLVKSGAVDLITLHVDQYPQDLPLHRILNMEQLVSRQQSVDNIIKITEEISETKKILDKELKKNNIKVLYWMQMGPTGIMTKEPVTTLAELKGKKINFITAYQRGIFEELGLIPVNVQIPELYEGMMRGVIDAIFMATAAAVPLKWYEIAKTNLVIGNLIACSQPIAINLKVWNSLPSDVQKAFIEASRETALWSVTHDKEIIDGTYALFEQSGVKIVQLPQAEVDLFYETLVKHSVEDWQKTCEAAGLKDEAAVILKYWQDMIWGK
jgi:TRAP-type C4-dicarboxylate transport system substrate-binding protein